MKRMLLPSASLLLCLAAACKPVATNTNTANTNAANSNAANSNTTTTAAAWSESDITAKERELWEAIKAKNWDAFAALLADDQVYVGPDGVENRAQSLEGIRRLNITDYTLSDWRMVRLDNDAAVITYTSVARGDYAGQAFPADMRERASTVWVNRNGRWAAVLHHVTAAQEPPPAASPSPAATTAAASPAASPATAASPAATTADVEANERMIWDLLKRKQWDAFASHLAEDAIEIEPIGVWTKEGTVRGVQGIDFSKVTLGDFRTVRLDADAAVVTYTVTGGAPQVFGPRGARHTTVWVNRGGRWQAAFHQGTWIEQMPPPAASPSAAK